MSALRSYYERWVQLEAEKKANSNDLKELFAEGKGEGYDGKALRLAFRRKAKEENESEADIALEAQVALYLAELDEIPTVRTSRATRESQLNTAAPNPPVPEGKGSGKDAVAEVLGAATGDRDVHSQAAETAVTGDQDKAAAVTRAPAPVPPATSSRVIEEDIPGFLDRRKPAA